MNGLFGVNCLTQFVQDRVALLQYLQRLNPASIVAMDDIGFSRQVKSMLPATTVIHRQYHPRDHEFYAIMTPTEWVTAHAQFGQEGIVVQCLNEPQGYGDVTRLVNWCVEVMERASGAGIRLCLPSFAVGHPDVNLIAAGAFDPLWRAFNRYPQHLLSVHEYAVFSTQDERPYRIGRFLESLARIDRLELARPRIVVTESGRDIGGGQNDGWRAVFNEQEYADFLYGLKDFYSAYNVSACIFCYGRGADGRWQSFDVEGAGTLLNKLAEFNGVSGGTGQMVKVYKVGATYSLNVRRERVIANNIIGSVAPNEVVQLVEVSGGWVELIKANGIRGFVSEQTGAVTIRAA